MKKFLKNTTWIFVVLIGTIILFYGFSRISLKYTKLFTLDSSVKTLILGDSHTKYSLNDSIIKNTKNYSNDADCNYYTFLKLKTIYSKNKHIDTLLLGLSSHNIDSKNDSKWFLNDAHLKSRFKYYIALMTPKDFYDILKYNPKKVIQLLPSIILTPFYVLSGDEEKYGGFEKYPSQIQNIQESFNTKPIAKNDYSISSLETYYIKKIVTYCKKHNIHLILINTPTHALVKNENTFPIVFLKNHFLEFNYIDLYDYHLDDECFGDYVHLNEKGAKIVSNYINRNGLEKLSEVYTVN